MMFMRGRSHLRHPERAETVDVMLFPRRRAGLKCRGLQWHKHKDRWCIG